MIGCDTFSAAIEQLLDHEGNGAPPGDPGGETRYGVTRGQFLGHGGSDEAWDAFTKLLAVEWYHDHVWLRYRFHDVTPPRMAGLLFNLAVNAGPGDAVCFVQRALNRLGGDLVEDGELGPITRGAIRAYPHARALIQATKTEANLHYYDQRRPEWINGWLNRLETL